MSETRKQQETLAETARRLGISVGTLKARRKREREAAAAEQARKDLPLPPTGTAGWGGNRKRSKGW